MNVSGPSIANGQVNALQVQQEVATRTARKTLDVAKSQGKSAVELMRQAGHTQKQAFAAEPHKGGQLDLLA